MILYHGTNADFGETDLTKSKPNKDFGQGYYDIVIGPIANDRVGVQLWKSPRYVYSFLDSELKTGSIK